MAAATTAITSPPSGPLVTASGDPKTPTSAASTASTSALFPQSDSLQSSVTSAAAAGLRASLSPKSKLPASAATPSPLTGAAAMEDERRHREQQATRMSPNPAHQALNSLLGSSGSAMSKSTQAPKAATEMSEPLARVAKSITIPDKVTADTMQTSPTSLSSLGSVDTTTAPTVTASDTATAGPSEAAPAGLPADVTTPTQSNVGPAEQPSNRAFTFPGPVPIESDPRGPMRNMSLPGYGNSPKSPSNKRHKCPYCATDFTRHHNLKSHLLTHSQEKPYECPTCQARFRRLHDLKRHTKLHTGERPHTCNRCGRRFARGDALARHTKGQGGCAGRRSSFGLDEEGEGRGDTMDGLTYHGDGDDDEHMDEDMPSERRVSEPASRNRQNSTQGSFHPNSSTYPPLARMATNQPSIYSGGPSGASSQTNSLQPHRERAISSSSLHFNAPSSVFAHGGMTESPKPISPGQSIEQHRLGVAHDPSLPGGRSPSLSQQIHQQQLARGVGRGTSPMSIPPPANSHAPQLPTLPGLNPSDNRAIASKGPSVQITTQSGSASSSLNQQMPGPGSNPSSVSSHGQGSGNSMRDITGSGRDDNMWAYIREVEARFAQKNDDYERKIRGLEEEIVNLRSQLQHQGGSGGR